MVISARVDQAPLIIDHHAAHMMLVPRQHCRHLRDLRASSRSQRRASTQTRDLAVPHIRPRSRHLVSITHQTAVCWRSVDGSATAESHKSSRHRIPVVGIKHAHRAPRLSGPRGVLSRRSFPTPALSRGCPQLSTSVFPLEGSRLPPQEPLVIGRADTLVSNTKCKWMMVTRRRHETTNLIMDKSEAQTAPTSTRRKAAATNQHDHRKQQTVGLWHQNPPSASASRHQTTNMEIGQRILVTRPALRDGRDIAAMRLKIVTEAQSKPGRPLVVDGRRSFALPEVGVQHRV